MPAIRHKNALPALLGGLALGLLMLVGCSLTRAELIPPTPTVTPAPAPPDTGGWELIRPGIERRMDTIGGQGSLGAAAVVVRIDPAQVTFAVGYRPGEPLSLNDWRAALPGAAVIVNGAFFDENNRALGLIASEGQVFGQTFRGFGGMFQVSETGPRVRSLVGEPYLGEPLWHAVQSFPMLVEAGGVPAPRGQGFDDPARRTVIAQDGAGRILLIVTPLSEATFSVVQGWLLESDLDVQIAFALDGGRSTGLALDRPGGTGDVYAAFDRLPSVIAVFPR